MNAPLQNKDLNTSEALSQKNRLSGWRAFLWPKGLSGKLLILTTIFIIVAEILIFVPSMANFRLTWIARHFTTGEAASLALLEMPLNERGDKLREQLLDLTETELIAVRKDGVSHVLASRQMPRSIDDQVMVEAPGRIAAVNSITEAFDTLLFGGDRIMRVFGPMTRQEGVLELVMPDRPLRDAMLGYARNVAIISLLISIGTGILVFLTLRWFFIRPLQMMGDQIRAFAADPEDAKLVIKPSGRRDEIGIAEEQFSDMQKQVRGTLNQKRHLADLGLAVSKINHDLRNILASASLFSDRLNSVDDPTVKRVAPRIVRSIDRAVDYTSEVLAYGKAGEAEPKVRQIRLHRVLEDVAEALALDVSEDIDWQNQVARDLEISADSDQIFRVLSNLCRNAHQVMSENQSDSDGSIIKRIRIEAEGDSHGVTIHVSDTGPGFPETAGQTLFSPFRGSKRSGGTGLGLAIAAELVRSHGGHIALTNAGKAGARFRIWLPDQSA